MAEMKEAPASASMGVKLVTWFDNRFPTMFVESRKHMYMSDSMLLIGEDKKA